MDIEGIRIDCALNYILPKSPCGIYKYNIFKTGFSIDTKHNAAASFIASYHFHNHNSQINFHWIKFVNIFITDTSIGKIACKTHFVRPKKIIFPFYIKICLILSRKRCGWRILSRCGASNS